jgi:hypothetical protein
MDGGGAFGIIGLTAICVLGYWSVMFITAIFRNFSSIGTVLFLESVLFSALVGAIIGWLRRAFHIRSKLEESFLSALLIKVFEGDLRGALTEIILHGAVGYTVGVAFALGEVSHSQDVYLTRMGMVTWGIGGAGGAAGGPDDLGIFWILVAILALLLAATSIGIISMLIADKVAVWLIIKSSGSGAATGAAEEFTSVLVEKESAERSALRIGAFRGAMTGFLVGFFLLLYPREFGIDVLYVTNPIYAGNDGSLVVSTTPGTTCNISLYYYSELRRAKGLEAQIAGSKGLITWTWPTSSDAPPGPRSILLFCSHGQETMKLTAATRVS